MIEIKVLNKYLALEIRHKKNSSGVMCTLGSPSVVANPYELVKQERMLEATGRKLPVPRFGCETYYLDLNDLDAWSCGVRGLTRDQIEPLDFSKPYDEELMKELHKSAPQTQTKQELNADDLINAELEE